MKKKAQGLSMQTIVIAALALLVLVILALVFTGRMGSFATGVKESTTCKNMCEAAGYADASTDANDTAMPGYTYANGNQCYCK